MCVFTFFTTYAYCVCRVPVGIMSPHKLACLHAHIKLSRAHPVTLTLKKNAMGLIKFSHGLERGSRKSELMLRGEYWIFGYDG